MANKTEQVLEATENINNREAFFMKYKKAILIAVAAIIVVIAGVFLYISQISGPREEKASTALSKGQTYFNNEMFEQAVNGDGAGFVGFAKLADEYSGTKAGNLANLYAGLCYANLGKWAEAQKSLDAFSTEGDQMISPASQAALGDAYAHLNQLDKAVDAFKKAADMADSKAEDDTNNSLSPTFLIKAGEVLESQGKKDEAEATKEKVAQIAEELVKLEALEEEYAAEIKKRMQVIPQIIDPSVPIGKDDSENVEIERFGEPFVPDFEVPYHVDIME